MQDLLASNQCLKRKYSFVEKGAESDLTPRIVYFALEYGMRVLTESL